MKITIEAYGCKHTTETDHDDMDIYEICSILKGLLFSCGFSITSINDVFVENIQ